MRNLFTASAAPIITEGIQCILFGCKEHTQMDRGLVQDMADQYLSPWKLLEVQGLVLLERLHCSLLTGNWPLVRVSWPDEPGLVWAVGILLVCPVSWRRQGVSHSPGCHFQV